MWRAFLLLMLGTTKCPVLVMAETGKSAQEYIQSKLIEVAKERMFDPSKSVSEVAYELGFQYPQHFSRFFKQRVAPAPGEFRGVN